MAPENLLALLLAGVVRQCVKHHHPVGEPPPDQGGQNEDQRRNQPQRDRHHQRHEGQHRGAHGPSDTRDERPAFFALQVRKTPGSHQGHQGRRHQHRHRQQRHHHQHRRHSQHHHQRRHDGRHIPKTPALEPAPDAGQQRGGVEQSAHCLHCRVPVKVAQAHRQQGHQGQGQQRQRDHAGTQAVGGGTPERIKQ